MASFIHQRATLIIIKIDSVLDMDIYPMLLLVSGGEVVVLFVSVSVQDFQMILKIDISRDISGIIPPSVNRNHGSPSVFERRDSV